MRTERFLFLSLVSKSLVYDGKTSYKYNSLHYHRDRHYNHNPRIPGSTIIF